jgi:hypothetical protein
MCANFNNWIIFKKICGYEAKSYLFLLKKSYQTVELRFGRDMFKKIMILKVM